MKLATFKDLAAGIQSLALALGVIVGGLWTYFTFHQTKAVERATIELQAARTQAARISVNSSIDVQSVEGSTSGARALLITVSVENLGSKPARLDLTQKPLYVTKILWAGDIPRVQPNQEYEPRAYTSLSLTGNHPSAKQECVEPGAKRVLSYYQEIREDGVYYIRFQVPRDTIGTCIESATPDTVPSPEGSTTIMEATRQRPVPSQQT